MLALCLVLEPRCTLGADGLATNDFGNNGETSVPDSAYEPGKKERESDEYKRENPDAGKRDYYEKGGASGNHDGACRARLAYKAARYQGPANGYETGQTTDASGHRDGPRPKAGGGSYAAKLPEDPCTIIRNIYKFVEDITYPKKQPSPLASDSAICGEIEQGTIDIGTPHPSDQFMCIETTLLFTSLVRELGFPAREKNILPSFANGRYDVQTAAANVWCGGKWIFFDPWESFTDTEDYLKGTGHAGYVGPTTFHDADIWVRESAPRVDVRPTDFAFRRDGTTARSDWKKIKRHQRNGARIDTQTIALRLGVRSTSVGSTRGGLNSWLPPSEATSSGCRSSSDPATSMPPIPQGSQR